MDARLLTPGFRHGVLDPQVTFRASLSAMSRPGLPVAIDAPVHPPEPLNPATAALALTLFDADTPIWLEADADTAQVQTYLKFHCGCPIVKEPAQAAFAMVARAERLPDLGTFDIGDEQYPDRSCTLIVQLASLGGGTSATLTGPGVNGEIVVAPRGLPFDFAERWAANHGLFPQGVDIFLTSGRSVLGLPRSVEWSV